MATVDSPAYTSRRPVRTITQARPAAAPYVERQPTTVVERQPRVVTRTRSTGKSAAIVAGSAGAGAAIGALAGGGKGAAIGAISGGAGGFVYDRMTRKKRVVVE